jgi:hypothetical protein
VPYPAQSDALEVGFEGGWIPGPVIEAREEGQILGTRQIGVAARFVAEEGDGSAGFGRIGRLAKGVPCDPNLTVCGSEGTGEHSQQGRLSRAVGTDEEGECAGLEARAYVANDPPSAIAAREIHRLQGEGLSAHAAIRWSGPVRRERAR